jgi:hypothetical protein
MGMEDGGWSDGVSFMNSKNIQKTKSLLVVGKKPK